MRLLKIVPDNTNIGFVRVRHIRIGCERFRRRPRLRQQGLFYMKIAVAVATAGRPEILAQTLQRLNDQTRVADRIVVCPAKPSDFVAPAGSGPSDFTVVHGRPGLPAQRNSLLKASQDMDVVVFFDDDFFAQDDYLAAVDRMIIMVPVTSRNRGWPNHVSLSGHTGLDRPSYAMTEQVRAISRERVVGHAGSIDEESLDRIRVYLRDFLDLW